MSTYQDILDSVALVAGGTRQSAPPYGFFSGANANDGSGIAGLNGCYSQPPINFTQRTPIGIVVPESFRATLNLQGYEENIDRVRLLILHNDMDLATSLAILEPFRDLVPAAFRQHMQLSPTNLSGAATLDSPPLYTFVTDGRLIDNEWQGETYLSWSFTIELRREIGVIYQP